MHAMNNFTPMVLSCVETNSNDMNGFVYKHMYTYVYTSSCNT